MEFLQFSDVRRLTGLSENQLREWCGKRGLFQPAVPARGPGKVALYSWQDVVALRVFREIVVEFGGRVSSWSPGVAELRCCLERRFFPNLWGSAAIFQSQKIAHIGQKPDFLDAKPVLFVPLDPHLEVIVHQATPAEMQGKLPLIVPVEKVR